MSGTPSLGPSTLQTVEVSSTAAVIGGGVIGGGMIGGGVIGGGVIEGE